MLEIARMYLLPIMLHVPSFKISEYQKIIIISYQNIDSRSNLKYRKRLSIFLLSHIAQTSYLGMAFLTSSCDAPKSVSSVVMLVK